MAKTRVFISFDYDNDSDLKTLLVGQAANPNAPFDIADWSIKIASPTWRDEARRRIRASDVVAVICGLRTHTATGVAAEVSIAQEEGKPYFLLWGRTQGTCTKPTSARSSDKLYRWTWDDLKSLVGGSR
ncbi:TIR domain-containing protein [Cellulomonas phragmiteti]|uniref:Thoeris protein ThsB TIR-like domain-containing protein n=1 Tax=Cellulomonas phragmiteti TaxID=478780 RepID=A0ABQ4DN15_9CELL|nr:TIR domain-containing protein [Cellulomonas phragmiteti]GIG40735.1 hypothetical protein Cph01nite_24970 [Cellulomonas phragmiteti]